MKTTLEIGGLAPSDVYQVVVDKGLTPSEAAAFVGQWILETTGKTKRVFRYKQGFPDADPACASTFARSFQHADWVDGESVVQASQTPGELGFNERFHRIEFDLDGLATDVAKAFTCLATMRAQLARLLDEIRVEINRINADVDACCNKGSSILTTSPAVAAGASFVGKFKVQEKTMQLWDTKSGMVMLPDVETVEAPAWASPRPERVAEFMRFVAEDARVARAFRRGVTKAAFLEKFGNERLPNGSFARDVVASLPENARYASLDAMAADLMDREVAALNTTTGANAAIAVSLGVGTDAAAIGDAAILDFGALPARARMGLARAGVDTLGKFAGMAPAELQRTLVREGITDVGAGDLAFAAGIARTLTKLR